MNAAGIARTLAVAGLTAGAVAALTHGPSTRYIAAGAPDVARPATAPGPHAVARRTLVCPGPRPDAAAPVTVAAASAPGAVPSGLDAGLLTIDSLPASRPLTSADAAGRVVGTTVDTPSSLVVTATEGQAATLAAAQALTVPRGTARLLAAVPCTEPSTDAYLVGGSGDAGAQESVVLTNPGPAPVSVAITVLRRGVAAHPDPVALGAGQRAVVPITGIAGADVAPVVRVQASGGAVAATLRTAWVDGIVGRGGDDAVPAAVGRALTIPAGVLPGAGGLRVRLAAPQGLAHATVTLRGATTVTRTLVVGSHQAGDIDLPSLAAGAWTVDIRSDAPVTAGAGLRTATVGGVVDEAWVPAIDVLTSVTGTPLPAGSTHTLLLGGSGPATVTLTHPDATTTSSRVAVSGPLALPLGDATAAWVTPVPGARVVASVTSTVSPDGAPLVSVLPLVQRASTSSPVVVEDAR